MPKSSKKVVRTEMRALSSLTPHPRNTVHFRDLADPVLAQLVDDIREHGLHHPIEILADGTILCGHQRCRAYELLGLTEIECVVRHDLDGATEEAIERAMMRDNQIRRQLDLLGHARVLVATKLSHDRENQKDDDEDDEGKVWISWPTVHQQMSDQCGMTERNARRYIAIARAPEQIQRAFELGKLTLQAAAMAATASKAQQGRIVASINAGDAPKDAVNMVLGHFRASLKAADPVHTATKAIAAVIAAGFLNPDQQKVIDGPARELVAFVTASNNRHRRSAAPDKARNKRSPASPKPRKPSPGKSGGSKKKPKR